jgi:hypothetical protein
LPGLILRLYLSVYPDLLERSVLGFWGKYNIDEFEPVIEDWVTRDNINLFEDSPIICAIRSLASDIFPFHMDRWIEALLKLIRLGADLHRRSETTGLSLLHEILAVTYYPFLSSGVFNFWVGVLTEAGVDMNRYLKVELDLYHKGNPIFIEELDNRRRYIIVNMDIYGNPHFSWDWWIDPHSPAHDVLEEFRNFGPACHDIVGKVPDSSLKAGDNYPFFYRLVHNTNQPPKESPKYAIQNWDDRNFQIGLWNTRGERRRKKKALKLAKARGLYGKPFRLPGAWIE